MRDKKSELLGGAGMDKPWASIKEIKKAQKLLKKTIKKKIYFNDFYRCCVLVLVEIEKDFQIKREIFKKTTGHDYKKEDKEFFFELEKGKSKTIARMLEIMTKFLGLDEWGYLVFWRDALKESSKLLEEEKFLKEVKT